MKQYLKTTIAIVLTAIVTFMATAYFVAKSTKGTFVAATSDMEAFNVLHRIRSWDSLEQLLVKGCNEEALEYVRMEQSLGLGSLKWHLDNGAKLENKVEEENGSILNRAHSFVGKSTYDIPTCK